MEHNSSDVNNPKKTNRKVAGAAVLQSSVTNALHRALFEEWAETGYAALRMERIAARAGVGKAALYRRWKSKYALVTDAVSSTATAITPIPDTGSLESDVEAIIRSIAVTLRHPLVRRILPDLHAERARSDELAELLVSVSHDRREQASVLLERAIARGEISETIDRELALDFLIAPIYWRIVVQRHSVTTTQLRKIANAVIISITKIFQ